MADIKLLFPQWLLLMPVLLLLYVMFRRKLIKLSSTHANILTVRHPLAMQIEESATEKSEDKRNPSLVFIAALFFTLALSQPVKPGDALPAPPAPVDLMLIIDTSVSMMLKDYAIEDRAIDRMTMTKILIDRFIERYQGKRIGLVVLGDKPHVLLKPTEDHQLARHLVGRLQTTIAGRQAAIGDAITVAAKSLDSNASETVLVLISDAVLPAGDLSPVEGARRVKQTGATLHTIAIGSTGMQEQLENTLLYEPADINLMQQLAEITGGKNFHATDANALDKALNEIEKDQISAQQITTEKLLHSLYIWPLGIAILILVYMMLIPLFRNTFA